MQLRVGLVENQVEEVANEVRQLYWSLASCRTPEGCVVLDGRVEATKK